ncbi:MAG TPA: nuclear transport factor 2 family protein [Usitatibacter sp.]|nr:nuclear transport factor 2 family protein [Usitatibacter sp.]
MHPHETLIRDFYRRFAARDAAGMARCYHPDVAFSDPVFPMLRGDEAGDMWKMLLSRAQDLAITLDEAHGDADGGQARWTARYTFTRTGRPVVNHVRGMFAFRDGLIVRHFDSFPFWRWAAQALGPAGAALGWLPPLKWKVRKDAQRALARYRAG